MPASVIQFRASPATVDWLAIRAQRAHTGSPDLQAKADLGLLASLLGAETRRLALSVDELCCLADVLGDPLTNAGIGRVALGEANDAFALAHEDDPTGGAVSSYAAKWGINETVLLAKLRLTPTQDYALRDALAAWRQLDCEPTAAGFAVVGLSRPLDLSRVG